MRAKCGDRGGLDLVRLLKIQQYCGFTMVQRGKRPTTQVAHSAQDSAGDGGQSWQHRVAQDTRVKHSPQPRSYVVYG